MSGSAADNDRFRRDAEEIRAELRRLDQIGYALEKARAELEHESRRVAEALVKTGGRSTDCEGRARQLQENIALTRKDLHENHARRQKLEVRLKDIERELDRNAC